MTTDNFSSDWISIDTPPSETGWYEVKVRGFGESKCYYGELVTSQGLKTGRRIWLFPDPSVITHYRNKTKL